MLQGLASVPFIGAFDSLSTVQAKSETRSSLMMVPGREFAASSYVHAPLGERDVSPRSAIWVEQIERQIRDSYGVARVNIDEYAPPIHIVGADEPTVRIKAERTEDPSWSFEPFQDLIDEVPIPGDFAPSAGADGEAIIYQPSSGRYWELWRAEKTGRQIENSAGLAVNEWRAAWGGRIDDLGASPGYFVGEPGSPKFGTTATGLPLLAGLMTIEEQRSGVIRHPIHIALVETRRSAWMHPAQRTDGQIDSDDAIPEGATFRLPLDLDLNALGLSPYCLMIAKAVQEFGMIVRDKSGAVVFYAENPLAALDAAHPYYGRDGILGCPGGAFTWSCAPDTNNLLRGFPWSSLVGLDGPLVTDATT